MKISPSYEKFLKTSNDLKLKSPKFYEHLLEIHQQTNKVFLQVVNACNGDPVGHEFKKKGETDWAFIVHEMSEPEDGICRIQYFRENGFYNHYVFTSIEKAVEDLAKSGFVESDKGILDSLQQTPTWARGMEIADIIRRCNSNQLSWEEANAEYAILEEKYSVA